MKEEIKKQIEQDKPLAEFFADLDDELIQDYKSQGKLHPDFLPFVAYDLVQCGYPCPDHGEMIPRRHGGTDAQDRLLPSTGQWCRVEDVKAILSKWQESEKWRSISEEEPPLGEEVLFFNEAWIDEDFNPKGIRIGFRLDKDYVSAHYWSHQDCYMTISHSECDDNPAYSDKTKQSIEPQKWKPII